MKRRARRRMFTGLILALVGLTGISAAPIGAFPSESESAGFSSAVSEFRLQLHALVGETLMLQLRTQTPEWLSAPPDTQKIFWDVQNRLSDTLRSANALLSMLEIADHSDKGPRVREILMIWLESSQKSLEDHRSGLDAFLQGREIRPETVEFIEELKMLWGRLDRAYSELKTALAAAEGAEIP